MVAYYAPQFAELRRRCVVGGEAAFLASMSRCRKWESRGGKSNAYFAKSRDDRRAVFLATGYSLSHCWRLRTRARYAAALRLQYR